LPSNAGLKAGSSTKTVLDLVVLGIRYLRIKQDEIHVDFATFELAGGIGTRTEPVEGSVRATRAFPETAPHVS
jgi:hypothetical protein